MEKSSVYNDRKLYYIHGYLSSPESIKGTLFKNKLNAKPIRYRTCKPEDLILSECLENIKKEIKNDQNVILIGSSLGGFLATKTAQTNLNVKQLILLNPAMIPPDYNITRIKGMPQKILKNMQDKELFKIKLSAEITILVGTEDTLVPNCWPIEFAKSQQATIKFYHDNHSFTKNIEQLPNIIKKLIE